MLKGHVVRNVTKLHHGANLHASVIPLCTRAARFEVAHSVDGAVRIDLDRAARAMLRKAGTELVAEAVGVSIHDEPPALG